MIKMNSDEMLNKDIRMSYFNMSHFKFKICLIVLVLIMSNFSISTIETENSKNNLETLKVDGEGIYGFLKATFTVEYLEINQSLKLQLTALYDVTSLNNVISFKMTKLAINDNSFVVNTDLSFSSNKDINFLSLKSLQGSSNKTISGIFTFSGIFTYQSKILGPKLTNDGSGSIQLQNIKIYSKNVQSNILSDIISLILSPWVIIFVVLLIIYINRDTIKDKFER